MIDIVTTTYRSADKLRMCIESVTEKTKSVDYKWYIWCNDPNDEIKKVIDEAIYFDDILISDKIVPIFNDNNDGSFSSNNNEAAAEGDGEFILFLNDDIYPINDSWLYSMEQILKTDPKVGAVGALLMYPDQKTVQHCGVMFSQRTNDLPFHIHYRQPLSNYMMSPRYYQAVTGACMLMRRSDFEEIGGFSEKFFYGFEDIALCLDIKHKLKKRCVFNPGAQLIHHEGISGTFKTHPKLQENIGTLREDYKGKFFNDEMFYLRDKSFMIYKSKKPVAKEDSE